MNVARVQQSPCAMRPDQTLDTQSALCALEFRHCPPRLQDGPVVAARGAGGRPSIERKNDVNAIAGVYHLSGRLDARAGALAGIRADAIGGTGLQVWAGGPVAMAARPGASRTARSAAGCLVAEDRRVIAADVRLDNSQDLIARLGLERTASDLAVVLRAFQRWGADCVDHLLGDFAFAIWDPDARTVFCARDPMGVRPFYYHSSPRQFAFATEVRGLLALDGVDCGLDTDRLSGYVLGVATDREKTFYRGIARLPAAHSMTVGEAGVHLRRYWTPGSGSGPDLGSDDEYAEAFREIFIGSVRARMEGGAPTAAALSGGLDSSSIVCTARSLSGSDPDALHTFSLVFPGLPASELQRIDERRFISSVTRTGGITPHHVRGDLASPLQDVHRIVAVLDEPYATPNLYLHWAMYGAAGSAGATVFLDGFDGDSAVSHGLGRLNTLLASGDWSLFEQETRAFAEKRGTSASSVLRYYGLPHLHALAQHGRWREWLYAARELYRRFGVSRRDLALTHGLAASPLGRAQHRRRPLSAPELLLRREVASVQRTATTGTADDAVLTGRAAHIEGLSLPLYQRTLEIASRCAADFGIEARYPFFDRRLIDFCVGLPEKQKFSEGRTRLVLRRAMEGILPREIQWRADKGNLGPAFHRGLRTADAAVMRSVDLEPLRAHVDVELLDGMREDYVRATSNGHASSDVDPLLLFRMTTLAVWLNSRAHAQDEQAASEMNMTTPAVWVGVPQALGAV